MKHCMNVIKLKIQYLPNTSINYARQHKYPLLSKYPVADAVGYSQIYI